MDGHVALVTGAGRGIGQAIALAFAGAGASVLATDIDADAALETEHQIGEAGGTGTGARLDVSDGAAVERTVALARDTYGRLDVAVNNAGVVDVAPLIDFPLDTWRRAFAVNVDGTFSVTLAAARVMSGQDPREDTGCRGKVITVSSGAADAPRPNFAAYGATKAAINHFIRERLAQTPTGHFESAANVGDIAVYIASARGMFLNGRKVWTAAYVDERDARAQNT